MKLYLIRHAIAEPPSASQPDSERSLTEEGRDKMKRAARGLRELDVSIDTILTSPLVRARQTAEILGSVFGDAEVAVLPELAAGAVPKRVLGALEPWLERENLALVGHEPDLGALASLLLAHSAGACSFPFRKGAVACFDGEIVPGGHQLQLEWFLTPRQLRAIQRP